MSFFKKVSFFIFSTATSFTLLSQNVNDVVRFSNIQMQGTARFESMGGSFGALGADLSSALVNPAGYGRYSSSQFGAGLNFNNIQNTATFQGVNTETSRTPVRPANIGIVFANDVSHKNNGLLFTQIGFTYNRVDNFTNRVGYKGKLFTSLSDIFANEGYGLTPEQLPTYSSALAYASGAIKKNGDGYQSLLTIDDTSFQKRNINSKGGVSEYTFTFSGNYLNKLYFGINWGIRTARFDEKYTHYETLDANSLSALDSFNYSYNLKTKGNGSNFKIGIIYLPVSSVRLGLALHTPTYYKMRDDWSASMQTFLTNNSVAVSAPIANYSYRLRSPGKIVGSAGFVFGTRGSVNIDLEYLNYAWGNLKSTKDPTYEPEPNNYRYQNEEIDQLLRSVLNVRVGGEMVFQGQYFLRGGFAYYPQPYKTEFADGTKAATSYSVGGGIKFNRSSIDLAYKIQSKNYNYYAFAESRTAIKSISQGLILSYSINF